MTKHKQYKKVFDYKGYHIAAIDNDDNLVVTRTWCNMVGLKIKVVEVFGDVIKGDG